MFISTEHREQGRLDGYIAGVVAVVRASPEVDICPPRNMYLDNYIDSVRVFVMGNRTFVSKEDASVVVVAALMQAYPCQPKGTF